MGRGDGYPWHPAQNVLDRFNTYGAKVYRTDLNGTVEIDTDGSTYNLITQKTAAQKQISPPPAAQTPAPAPAKVVISSIDLKGEIAVIKNNGSNDIDMTGWKLVSQTGTQTYNFPDGFILKAGAS
ncbi:MAG: lamin tail domain-containing protein, partial [Eubacteriales bacterium]